MATLAPAQTPAQTAKKYKTFTINVKKPVQASLFDTPAFVEFLVANFKATKGAKKGSVGKFDATQTKEENLAAYSKSVIISSNRAGTRVLIHTKTPLSKVYIKYMTKKYLKKNELRDYMRVLSTGKRHYSVDFINVKSDDATEEATEEAAVEETAE
eukprot:UN01617